MSLPKVSKWLKTLTAGLVVASGMCAPAAANPDVWVTVKYVLRFSEVAMTALAIEWKFDPYFSNRAIAQFDANGDAAFSKAEVRSIRAEFFDPLEDMNYFLHLISDQTVLPISADAFDAKIDGEHLVIGFTVAPKDPIDYRRRPISMSLFDKDVFFDFSFAEENFLLVDGPFDASCRFRVQAGDGPLKGHKKTVALLCGG